MRVLDRSASTYQLVGIETREQILDHAEHLARSRGYDAFSYADLATRVGIRKASIHHHFPKKSDLGQHLMERYRERFLRALSNLDDQVLSAGARLAGYLDLYRAALTGGETLCLCVAFSAGRDSLSDPILKELARFHDDSLAWLKQTYRLGQDDGTIRGVTNPELDARMTLALGEGAQLMARVNMDLAPFDQAVEPLKQRVS